jgi:phytanoyl-CoA hydroxylase
MKFLVDFETLGLSYGKLIRNREMDTLVGSKREQFEKDGYIVFEGILDSDTINRLNRLSDAILAEQDEAHFKENVTSGSMVLINWEMAYQHALLAEFIAHEGVLAALGEMGFEEPKFGHGRIISKPPHSPPLFWHEDGRFWDDPVSYTAQPIQCFLMYYLIDTTPENGCLRVIPGSHRKRHTLHDLLPGKQSPERRRAHNPDDFAFRHAEGEIDVPLKAGDFVMGYGNLLHAAHANRTDQRRTVLTMWYYPDFANLPERTRATVDLLESGTRATKTPAGSDQAIMEPLRIEYSGDAEPIEQQWVPGRDLK